MTRSLPELVAQRFPAASIAALNGRFAPILWKWLALLGSPATNYVTESLPEFTIQTFPA
jgi:hypothetical protein